MNRPQDDWLVAQLGARMHYAVPRILHEAGRLRTLATDIHLPSPHWQKFAKATARYQVAEIPVRKVESTAIASLLSRWWYRNSTDFDRYVVQCLGNADRLARLVQAIHRSDPIKRIYGFDTGALGCFKVDGIQQRTLEQCVAPRSTQLEFEELAIERGWRDSDGRRAGGLKRLHEIENQEWDLATQVIVPSQFVRDQIVNVRPEMENLIRVVPYGFTPKNRVGDTADSRRPKSNQGFTVLFAGTVSYRKGIADLIALARKLPSVNFRLVGGLEADLQSRIRWPENVSCLGKRSFPELVREYQTADLFFLPSYLEGSATVVYEAMSQGLPILTTHQAGSVVQDGVQGYVVSAGETETMRERISQLRDDPSLLVQMSHASIERSLEFTVDRYGERLVEALSSCDG